MATPDSQLFDAVVRLLGASAETVLTVVSDVAGTFVAHSDALAVIDGRLSSRTTWPKEHSVTAADIVTLSERASGSPAYGVLPAGRYGRPAVVFVAGNPRSAGAILVLVDATASTAAYRAVSIMWEVAATVLAESSLGLPTADEESIDSEWRRQLRAVRDDAAATLRSILASLRSRKLDDAAARRLATTLADQALTAVRSDALHLDYNAAAAFSVCADSLRPIVQNSDVELQLAPPDDSLQMVPEVITRIVTIIAKGVMLNMLEYTAPRHVRVGWDVTPTHLTLSVRDDGDGAKFPRQMVAYRAKERTSGMGAAIWVDAVPAWGTTITVRVPLDAPAPGNPPDSEELAGLTKREREVLDEIVRGLSNRLIAQRLDLSEHTVKFHVHQILHKLGVRSRGEAAALGRAARTRGLTT